jgi:hypothetical protein
MCLPAGSVRVTLRRLAVEAGAEAVAQLAEERSIAAAFEAVDLVTPHLQKA